jgi:hypothetical protein
LLIPASNLVLMDVSQVIFACASHPQVTAANGAENALFARALRLVIKERRRAGGEADDKKFISKLQDNLNQATKELRDLSDAGVSIESLLASCRIYGGFAAVGGTGAGGNGGVAAAGGCGARGSGRGASTDIGGGGCAERVRSIGRPEVKRDQPDPSDRAAANHPDHMQVFAFGRKKPGIRYTKSAEENGGFEVTAVTAKGEVGHLFCSKSICFCVFPPCKRSVSTAHLHDGYSFCSVHLPPVVIGMAAAV